MILDCPVLVITLAMFSSLSSKCEAHSFYFKVHRNPECTYSGYEPGGGVPNIKPIQSPVAKAQTTTIAFITGRIREYWNLPRIQNSILKLRSVQTHRYAKSEGQ